MHIVIPVRLLVTRDEEYSFARGGGIWYTVPMSVCEPYTHLSTR